MHNWLRGMDPLNYSRLHRSSIFQSVFRPSLPAGYYTYPDVLLLATTRSLTLYLRSIPSNEYD